MALAGAFWDLRAIIGEQAAEELFVDFLHMTPGQWTDDIILQVLAADDDDADLTNGTPHYAAIIDSFAIKHGWSNPECPPGSEVKVGWLGPITGPPLEGVDYIVVSTACPPNVTLKTTVKDGVPIVRWFVGRTLNGEPADLGMITAYWSAPGGQNIDIRVGTEVDKPCRNLKGIDIPAQSAETWSSVRLDLTGSLVGSALAHPAASGVGGLISGTVLGNGGKIDAQAIGEGGSNAGVLDIQGGLGRLDLETIPQGSTLTTRVGIDTRLNVHAIEGMLHVVGDFQYGRISAVQGTGDIIVDGEYFGFGASIHIATDMSGDILIGGAIHNQVGGILVRGTFDGNLCASNLSPLAALPDRVVIREFGPNARICGQALTVIHWEADPLSLDRTTRSLRLRVEAPVISQGSPGQSATKVTMVDLQHPDPRNLTQYPPPDFSTFDTGTHGICSGATTSPNYNGHHCGTNDECLGPNGWTTTDDGTCSTGPGCTAIGETNPPTANGIGGCARWVGKPGTFYEAQGPPLVGPYRAARLQCTAYYTDWVTETANGLITVVGAEIVPSSEYSVQSYGASCISAEAGCSNVSAPLTLYTRRKGDLDSPFQSPSPGALTQADVLDISQAVDSVLHVGPLHYRGQMQPNLPELNSDVNVLDIVEAVDSVKRLPYSFSGPCVCPSEVICGGSCTGCAGLCLKTCVGGDNDGQTCVNNTHCAGVCVGGTNPGVVCPVGAPGGPNCAGGGTCNGACSAAGTCYDKCGRCTPP